MLTSSLLGVKKLLHLLPDSDQNLLEDRLTQLISSAKFWKYSKHKTPQVTTSKHHCSVVTMCLIHLIPLILWGLVNKHFWQGFRQGSDTKLIFDAGWLSYGK